MQRPLTDHDHIGRLAVYVGREPHQFTQQVRVVAHHGHRLKSRSTLLVPGTVVRVVGAGPRDGDIEVTTELGLPSPKYCSRAVVKTLSVELL